MKFINYLESISGIAVFPMISLFIFLSFFTLLVVYAVKVKKEHIQDLKNIPLDIKSSPLSAAEASES